MFISFDSPVFSFKIAWLTHRFLCKEGSFEKVAKKAQRMPEEQKSRATHIQVETAQTEETSRQRKQAHSVIEVRTTYCPKILI